MSISYSKLFLLIKEKGRTEYYLRQNGIRPSIIDKMKNGRGGIDARTINRICHLLNCQPGDIMEYLEDHDGN